MQHIAPDAAAEAAGDGAVFRLWHGVEEHLDKHRLKGFRRSLYAPCLELIACVALSARRVGTLQGQPERSSA